MIFINNKYTTWYNSLTNKAKDRTITGYTEKHHIIPSSLGGTNDNDNIVKLTAREHFICHLLLTKMTTGNARYKMNFALHMLSNANNIGDGRYMPSSRLYEYAKKCFKESLTKYWTTEQRQLHGEKTRPSSLGRKHKDETIQKMKNKEWTQTALTNRLNNCLKAAEARKGSKWTDEKRKQMFDVYVEKNKHLFPQVLSMADKGINVRKISLNLGISWDRVKYILVNRDRINTFMTKRLEELFELPQNEIDNLARPIPENADLVTTTALDNLTKIEEALPQVRGLEAADGEMDELASLATSSYKDLMDLGMQVDSRFASEIFNSASSMLGHAITAKTAKLNKKLKMIELQLKKAALDHKMSEKTEEIENTPIGEGRELDRNELLKILAGKTNEK